MMATRWLTLPPPVRTTNAAGAFDATRAKARLARVLGDQAPHPADTAASDGVRSRLIAELRGMGLQLRVDDRFACNNLHKQSGVSCARVRNVLVTLGERLGSRHLLINSHYDSVPVGPGASDAGLGVATMLETAFLLKDRQLGRPVTFLFNEGEELGLVGARAFLDGDPLRDRVDALINLEARGTTGPVNMFETSVPNAAPIAVFKNSVSHPVANSLAVSAYRLIPNYTDVNTFAESRRWLTLNFAPIGNETRYHSPGDDLAGMDLATLQHMGDQVVESVGKLAQGPAPQSNAGEQLFMNLGTRWLLTYPLSFALILTAGTGLGLAVWRGRDRQPVRLLRTIGAVGFFLIALASGAVLAWLGLALAGALREGQFWRAWPQATEFAIYAGVIAAGLAWLTLSRRWSQHQLRRAWWLTYLLAGFALTAAAPGALIYFLWPPLLALAGIALSRWWAPAEVIGSLAAALFTYLTLGATLGLLQDLLNGGPLWVFALIGGLVLLPWLVEARPLLGHPFWRRAVPLALSTAAFAWLPAALLPAYSADRQQHWTLQYVAEAGKPPLWSIVNDRKPLPPAFTKLAVWRLTTIKALGKRQRWVAPAPVQPGFAAPTLVPAGDITVRGGRSLLFRLNANGADTITLAVNQPGAVIGGGFNGRAVLLKPETKAPYTFTCTGRSCDGAVVQLDVAKQPVAIQLTATHWRLPPGATSLPAARPADARPQYLPDATILVSRFEV